MSAPNSRTKRLARTAATAALAILTTGCTTQGGLTPFRLTISLELPNYTNHAPTNATANTR